MVLLNSDILLYLRDPKWSESLAEQLQTITLVTCNVVVAEVLSNRALDKSDAFYYAELFEAMHNHPFNEEVTKHVIELCRSSALDLTDAIIAATAVTSDAALWTHELDKFKGIRHLRTFDPLAVKPHEVA